MIPLVALVLGSLIAADADLSNERRFGHVVSDQALVRVSSTSQWDEPEYHLSLVAEGHTPFAFHTGDEERPWVWIDLGEPHRVTGIAIDNRTGGNGVRTKSFAVATSSDARDWTEALTLEGPKPQWSASLLDGESPRAARFVRIQLAGKGFLHLSRVRIWGDPPQRND